MTVHGVSEYSNHRCRCTTCREAWRGYIAQLRARRAGTLEAGDPRHGTNGYVNYACRCTVCVEAQADYARARWAKSRPATTLEGIVL